MSGRRWTVIIPSLRTPAERPRPQAPKPDPKPKRGKKAR